MLKVIIAKKAKKQLMKLKGTSYFERIIEFLEKLQEKPFPKGYDIEKVKGEQTIRVRFGKYRLFYEIEKKRDRAEVYAINLRKTAYK